LWQYEDMARRYEMRRRAEQVEQTRLRITEAAIELHGTVGPARTTITSVAERAGVDRLTVYRHFPNEEALFHACSSHWLALHPPPDPAGWASVDEPRERLRDSLGELYAWYRATHPMMELVRRDAPLVPALGESRRVWDEYLADVLHGLRRGWRVRGRRRVLLDAALAHAVDLGSWLSLSGQDLDDEEAAELMARFVIATAQTSTPRRAG
jgi:AcrR family transcriptional regulator